MEKTRKSIATVVKHTGSHYLLSELPEWKLFPAVVRGKLRLKDSSVTNPIAVGDRVEYSAAFDGAGNPVGEGVILSVLPRSNYVIRKSANLSRRFHIIASNVDCAFLVATVVRPEPKLAFIDRFLVTCEAYRVPVKIVLNKMDLYEKDEDAQRLLNRFRTIYNGQAGYEILEISALSGSGIDGLRQECRKGGLSLFAGISGVGKSSIIKALDPSLEPKIADISAHYLQGRHTTTFYEIYPLAGGGFIIDTPGLRGFGLAEFENEEISACFPEMLRVTDSCRYKPCTHTCEPGCAVMAAVREGTISAERYNSYLGMLEEEGKYR